MDPVISEFEDIYNSFSGETFKKFSEFSNNFCDFVDEISEDSSAKKALEELVAQLDRLVDDMKEHQSDLEDFSQYLERYEPTYEDAF